MKEFYSFCGGLPAPECAGNPLGYKFSWSPRGNLLVHLNSATYLAGGKEVQIPGKDLMNSAKPYPIVDGLSFVAFPNRSSLPFRDIYRIAEAETVMRGSGKTFPPIMYSLGVAYCAGAIDQCQRCEDVCPCPASYMTVQVLLLI